MKNKNFIFQTWERLTGQQNVNPIQGQTFKQVKPVWKIKSFKLFYIFLILVVLSLVSIWGLQEIRAQTKVIKFEFPIQLPATTAPTVPVEGMMYYDSGDSKFHYYTGSSWLELTSSATDTTCGASGICTTVYQGGSTLDSLYVSRNAWTDIDNYPTACSSGNFVRGIGDTLTCAADDDTPDSDAEVPDNLTISASGSVADGALSGSVSLLGTAIEKGEIANSGTLSFDWADSEISNTITASNYLLLTGGTLSGALSIQSSLGIDLELAVLGTGDSYFIGDVGIGVTNPVQKFDVIGNANIDKLWVDNGRYTTYTWAGAALTTPSIEIVDDDVNTPGTYPTLVFHDYGYGGPQFRFDGANKILYLEDWDNADRIDYLSLDGKFDNYLGLLVEGNVGIGLTNPTYKLDVAGTGRFTGDLTVSGASTNFRNAILAVDGSGSGINADLLDGYGASTTRNSANTIPVRNSSGYLNLGWINTTSGSAGTSTPTRIYGSYDDYIRYYTPANFANVMSSSFASYFVQTDGSNVAYVKTPNNYTGDLRAIVNAGVYFTEAASGHTNGPGCIGAFLQLGDAGGQDVRFQFFGSSDGNNLWFQIHWGFNTWRG
ncbi:hypothetical protein IID20_02455, partial [Patescibacteria group bacterium]|nr:hypothetical protein [Patescibacteria group bacterium]